MPHIKVVFLWPHARVGGVNPAYARAYAYAYHLCICIPPIQLGWKRDCYNSIIFSDIRRHFIERGKVPKEISINSLTTKIALDDGRARQKTRKSAKTTCQLMRFFCRAELEVARPDDGALAFARFYVQTVL